MTHDIPIANVKSAMVEPEYPPYLCRTSVIEACGTVIPRLGIPLCVLWSTRGEEHRSHFPIKSNGPMRPIP